MVFSNIKKREIHYKNVFCIFLYKEICPGRCRFDCVAIFVAIGQKSKINSNDVYNRSCISNELVHVLSLFLYFMRETPVSTWPSDSQSYSNLLFPYSNISLDMSDLCLSDAYSALQSNIHFKMIRLMSFNIHDNSQEYHICMVP